MIRLFIFVSILLTFLITTNVVASEQSASAKIPYSGWGLDSDERREAEKLALIQAVEVFVQKKLPSHYPNYSEFKAEIDQNVEDFVIKNVVTRDKQNKQNKTYEVWVRATINEPKLLELFLSKNPVTNIEDQAYFTFVFVARQVIGKEKRADIFVSKTESEDKKNKTNTVSTSIKEKNFSDALIYDVATTNEVDTSVSEVLSNANYLVIDAGLLEEETGGLLSVEDFILDYAQGDDLKKSTKRDALMGLQSLDDPIDYLVIGTLDIDEQLLDKNTDKFKVFVSITAKVLAIQKRGALVAAVKPTQYAGQGDTAKVALNNALILAAKEAGNELVGQLVSKGIR